MRYAWLGGIVATIGFLLSLDFWGSGKKFSTIPPDQEKVQQYPVVTQPVQVIYPSQQSAVRPTNTFSYFYSPLPLQRVVYYDPVRLHYFVTGVWLANYAPRGDFFAVFTPPWEVRR